MTLLADYTITETLREDNGSALYRATSNRDRHSVLLKTLVQSDRPQSREVARLRKARLDLLHPRLHLLLREVMATLADGRAGFIRRL